MTPETIRTHYGTQPEVVVTGAWVGLCTYWPAERKLLGMLFGRIRAFIRVLSKCAKGRVLSCKLKKTKLEIKLRCGGRPHWLELFGGPFSLHFPGESKMLR